MNKTLCFLMVVLLFTIEALFIISSLESPIYNLVSPIITLMIAIIVHQEYNSIKIIGIKINRNKDFNKNNIIIPMSFKKDLPIKEIRVIGEFNELTGNFKGKSFSTFFDENVLDIEKQRLLFDWKKICNDDDLRNIFCNAIKIRICFVDQDERRYKSNKIYIDKNKSALFNNLFQNTRTANVSQSREWLHE